MVDENLDKIITGVQAEMICRFTPDYMLTFVNAAFCRYFEMKEQDLLGRNYLELLPGDERPAFIERLSSLTMENPVVTYRHGIRKPGGTTAWREWTERAIFNSIGEVAAFQSVGRDVSDIVFLEELLIMQRNLAVELGECAKAADVYERVIDMIMRVEPVDSCVIYEHDPVAGSMELVSHRGFPPVQVEEIRSFSRGSMQYRIMMEGNVLYRENIPANPLPAEYGLRDGMRALGVIPVTSRGKVLAALSVVSHSADFFPVAVKAGVESVAYRMGSVIRNIRHGDELHLKRRNLLSLFNTMDDMSFILDDSGRILEINDATAKKLGYMPDELKMKSILDLFPRERRSESGVAINKMLCGDEKRCSIPFRTRSGTDIPVETYFVHGIWNEKKAVFCIARDVSGRLELEKGVSEIREKLEIALRGGSLGTWDWNIVTGEVIFNERWAGMLGYTLAEIKPHVSTWEKLLHPDDMSSVMAELNKHLAGLIPLYRVEHRLKTRDGSWKWVLNTGRVLLRSQDGAPLRAIGVHVDIDDVKNTGAMLREVLIRDPLVKIYNRRYVFEQIRHLIARNRRIDGNLAVAIAGIDFFRKINCSMGHLAGDSILREFAGLLSKNLGEDDLLGRYGGDEFIILFDRSNSGLAGEVMERIRVSAADAVFTTKSGESISLTFSCGISDMKEIPEADLNCDSLVELAEKRLLRARDEGRDRIVSR